MTDRLIEINVEELYPAAEEYMRVMCGFGRNTELSQKSETLAMKVREKTFDGMKMPFLVMPLEKNFITQESFEIKGTRIKCGALTKIPGESIKGGYAFIFRSPMPDISKYPISEMYLADSWETCFVDAGRDKLREILLKESMEKSEEPLYVTDTLAPGMAGMPSNAVRSFFQFLNADKIGLKLMPSGMMNPVKSFVGALLLIDKEQVEASMNCSECISNHKFCEYCKNYALHYMGESAKREIQKSNKDMMKLWAC